MLRFQQSEESRERAKVEELDRDPDRKWFPVCLEMVDRELLVAGVPLKTVVPLNPSLVVVSLWVDIGAESVVAHKLEKSKCFVLIRDVQTSIDQQFQLRLVG